MVHLSQESTDVLESRLSRLIEESHQAQHHPAYPFVDEIPGYEALSDEISRIENELDDRQMDASWQ